MAESRTVSIKGRIAGLNALQRGLLNKVAISQKVRAKTQTVAKKFLRILKQNHFSGPTSDTVLGARTGKLKKALGFQVAVAAGRFQGLPTIRYGISPVQEKPNSIGFWPNIKRADLFFRLRNSYLPYLLGLEY